MARRWHRSLGIAAVCGALLPAAGGLLYAATRTAPCDRTELTASIGDHTAAAPPGSSLDRLTIVLAGDTGFNSTDAKVDANGMRKGKQTISFTDALSGVAEDFDGDLAFANLETVITDRNDIAPETKGKGTFHFRSHPAAVKAMIDIGFNLFSLANNHSFDYGAAGVEESLYHLAVANAERAIAYAGIGSNFAEAVKPGCIDLDGTRIALSAIGIITGDQSQYRAGPNRAGQASYRDRPDFEAVVDKLVAMPADYRVLSIHYGLEGRVEPDERQLKDWRGVAAEEKGIDLIVGHHPHVAQGVELNGKSLIFYGLGNFLHPGTTEMKRFGICRDYGLIAKVHLARASGAWQVKAIEAIPLTETQFKPERFSAEEGTKRIYALNHLAAGLDDEKTAKGVRFTPQADGTGLYCADGAAELGGKLATLCQGWQEPGEPDQALAKKIAAACEDKPFYGKPAMVKRRVPQQRRRPAAPQPFPFGGPFSR
ncbi:MAG TPA: CapA family protein [Methyloceanibacter sp.]|jgi:poly-gamma-glutamate capsule biosynthesis protein CapA/YwtB (metallophosphatase superfamily)|nr:CapA family protein [Methyloceanibacter sp.]